MDAWLQKRALNNQKSGASRVFVVTDATSRVVGYYALAAGSVRRDEADKRTARNMPDPIPILVLGRLAVDQSFAGKGLGRGLLRDAVLRCVGAAESIGVRAIVIHALNDRAAEFYRGFGFRPSPLADLTLMTPLADARAAVEAAASDPST